MRKEIKTSLDALFEQEQLHIEKPTRKRRRFPILVGMGTIALACVIWLTFQTQSTNNQQASSDSTAIFSLKDSYIGSPIVSTTIANYVLPNMPVDHIALQTKEEPYGVTFYLTEDITAAEKLKYSFYSFALIHNHMNVTFEVPSAHSSLSWSVNRQELEKEANIHFQALTDEQQLLAAYYAYALPIFDVPRIYTHEAENLYKLFFNVAMKATPVKQELTTLPQYVFYLDELPYYVWIINKQAYVAASNDVLQVKRVPKHINEELQIFLNES